MTFFVCRIDGTQIGEFEEGEFRDKVFARQISAADYYWHEGMADWRPVADYRALAKTQKISFAPPVRVRPTIKIDMSKVSGKPRSSGSLSRLFNRLRGKK